MGAPALPIFEQMAPAIPENAYRLPVPGERPVTVLLTARRIYVESRNGAKLLDCQRTVECAQHVADRLAEQRLCLEADALRKEAARWRW